ncbi:MAG: hypothetical protein ACR2QO_05410 [Acidimicrobiales bacterium]
MTTNAEQDLAMMRRYADDLLVAVDASLGPWMEHVITERLPGPPSPELAKRAASAGEAARHDVTTRLRELLEADIDAQWTNPLSVIRSAVVNANEVLAAAGVAPSDRDAHDTRINPDDIYAIGPAAFGDLGPDVHEAGLKWGAAKAHIHLQRRRATDVELDVEAERENSRRT